MHITELIINDFRAFKGDENYTFNFSPHINCVSGHNGIGKSTILAILSNCGELKKKDGEQLNGKAFIGEYSQLIKGDESFDKSGDVCTLKFSQLPTSFDKSNPFVESLDFRSTFQNVTRQNKRYKVVDKKSSPSLYELISETEKFTRYRLLPKPTKERQTEKKLNWPSLYLGLSRLYPIGESEEPKKETISSDILDNIKEIHKYILSSNDEYTDITGVSSSDVSRKSGIGIETEYYSYLSNSSGQDNLGQILLSIFSFENLKNTYPEYCGGILLIDEIDATLHPAAQNKLLDFLHKKSKELELQIVFTTHSQSLLEYINFKNRNARKDDFITNNYLINHRGKVELMQNPTTEYIRTNLTETHRGFGMNKKITVITEDSVGRWLLDKILQTKNCPFISKLSIANTSIGWTEIIKLIKDDYRLFSNILIFLDPDISIRNNKEQLNSLLSGSQYQKKINKSNGNIFYLPFDNKIESLFWEYIVSLPANHPFYYDPRISDEGVTRNSIINDGPESDYFSVFPEKEKVKKWFEDNQWLCDVAFEFWEHDHSTEINSFYTNFVGAYNQIYNKK